MICFKISIFALSDTTSDFKPYNRTPLWFALKLVSLHYQTQLQSFDTIEEAVVICFKISIFALSDTTYRVFGKLAEVLWFALKLVSLHYQTQRLIKNIIKMKVVICFKISIFALSDTTCRCKTHVTRWLWFALKLVSLHYQTQPERRGWKEPKCCDLL